MPRGLYSVLRYIPDPARNEPLNIGVIATGPAGASWQIPEEALGRVPARDPYADKESLSELPQAFTALVDPPSLLWLDGVVIEASAFDERFLKLVGSQLGSKLSLSEPLYVDLLDESREAIDDAVKELIDQLVRPLRGRPIFTLKDPSAPINIVRRRLAPLIRRNFVHENAQFQGWSHRLRRPDLAWATDERSMAIVNVRLDYKRDRDVYNEADAKAFEILDIVRGAPQREVIALIQEPLNHHDVVEEALLSVRAVTGAVIQGTDERQIQMLVERIQHEAVA